MYPRCHLRKEFAEPYVEWVAVPMCGKKALGREVTSHPTRVASQMIRQELTDLSLLGPGSIVDEATSSNHVQMDVDLGLGDLDEKRPITQEAFSDGFRREHVVPLSVYFDGVQYSKNENFLGFYVTNLRTRVQRLVWLLRTLNRNQPSGSP